MKLFAKLSTALLATTVLASGAAQASDDYNRNYQPQVTTAATAKNLYDDTKVSIKGQITRKLSREKYELQDATGKIQVEIDDEDLRGASIVGKNITITGELDKKKNGTVKIDSDYVQIH
ncbi:NirD/YgiW/YdeI family stress tolerance protein [Moraxella pluranimalium]|uniref:Uncharacterized protein n=1 Tax=Moraxella pluranimalium TaxID=470453 RepID=A0A1T0CFN3_9GAMM|nr:NirD/YgiW/YdeI family stress tolerance protein [Moraxella pluranimalium]OOS20941.1 hypothetical protein B0680_10345 [Moraxella pluranimalium]